jgi:hypothetical protein
MSARYLFGPVTSAFAQDNLGGLRRRGTCPAFDVGGTSDLAIGLGDNWLSGCSRMPQGWKPDFLALWLPYISIPRCLWSAPVPVIRLTADWNLLWHYYRHVLPQCYLVLTDAPGVEVMGRADWDHVLSANLFGLEWASWEGSSDQEHRDIDPLFVGNVPTPRHAYIRGHNDRALLCVLSLFGISVDNSTEQGSPP